MVRHIFLEQPFVWAQKKGSINISIKNTEPMNIQILLPAGYKMSPTSLKSVRLCGVQKHLSPPADECKNSLLVSNSAHTLYTVKVKHPSKVTIGKTSLHGGTL